MVRAHISRWLGISLLLVAGVTPLAFPLAAQSGRWNGTIVLTRSASATYNTDTAAETEKHSDTLKETITITITNGKAEAAIDYLLKEHSDGRRDNEISTDLITTDRMTKGTGTTQNASFDIQTYDDGTYTLSFTAGGIKGTLDSATTVNIQCKTQDAGCTSGVQNSKSSDKVNDLSGGAGDVTAPIGGKPNALSGSAPHAFDFAGATRQGTVQWSLRR